MSSVPFPGWFNRHHESVHDKLDKIFAAILAANKTSAANFDALNHKLERLITMSETVSQQLDDAAVRDEAATAKLSADLVAIAAELKANAPDPGSVVTQAQADRHLAIATALEAAAAAADALVVTPPEAPAA